MLTQRRAQALIGFAAAFVMGTVFALVQPYEWHTKPFSPRHLQLSPRCTFVTTGFHIAHVLVGLLVLQRSLSGRRWTTSVRDGA